MNSTKNKYSICNYTKIHLISVIIILTLWDIFFIIRLIPSIPDSVKNTIIPYTIILSVASILLYTINIIYNLNIFVKHFQGKKTLTKKELFCYLGITGESISLLGINIVSTIITLTLPLTQTLLIVVSALNILSSIFVIEYASILLHTDIKKYKEKKEEKSPTKYITWSIINWVLGLIISIVNISITTSSFFTRYRETDIFKILLFTSYIIIISSMICMKSMEENAPSTSLNRQIEATTPIIEEETLPLLQNE